MPENASERDWKFVSSKEDGEALVRDLRPLFEATADHRRIIAEFCAARDEVYSYTTKDEIKTITEKTQLSEEDVESVFKALKYVIGQIIVGGLTKEDLAADLEALGDEGGQLCSLTAILDTLNEKRDDLHDNVRKGVQKEEASHKFMPYVRSLACAVDIRAVYDEDDDDKLIAFVPILVVRMMLRELRTDREVVFQMNRRAIDDFCEILESEGRKLKHVEELAGKIRYEE